MVDYVRTYSIQKIEGDQMSYVSARIGACIAVFLFAIVCVQPALAKTATVQTRSGKTCKLGMQNFGPATLKNVSCSIAKSTVKRWWQMGSSNSKCYTTKGCKVGAFVCGISWKGYAGTGRCSASGNTKTIVFSYGS